MGGSGGRVAVEHREAAVGVSCQRAADGSALLPAHSPPRDTARDSRGTTPATSRRPAGTRPGVFPGLLAAGRRCLGSIGAHEGQIALGDVAGSAVLAVTHPPSWGPRQGLACAMRMQLTGVMANAASRLGMVPGKKQRNSGACSARCVATPGCPKRQPQHQAAWAWHHRQLRCRCLSQHRHAHRAGRH